MILHNMFTISSHDHPCGDSGPSWLLVKHGSAYVVLFLCQYPCNGIKLLDLLMCWFSNHDGKESDHSPVVMGNIPERFRIFMIQLHCISDWLQEQLRFPHMSTEKLKKSGNPKYATYSAPINIKYHIHYIYYYLWLIHKYAYNYVDRRYIIWSLVQQSGKHLYT